MNRAKKVQFGIGAFIFLVIVGSCVGNDEEPIVTSVQKTPTTTRVEQTPIVNPHNEPIVVGTVAEVSSHRVTVEADNSLGAKITVSLAHVGWGSCKNLNNALTDHLEWALPVGAKVTVVRMPRLPGTTQFGGTAFIHAGADGVNGPSVNEQIVAAGNGVFNPVLDHGWDAAPIEEQLPGVMAYVSAQAEPYADAMVAAEIAAWDQSLGGVGLCRAEDEEARQRMMEQYGADGLAGTADDPVSDVYVDVDAPDVYVDAPDVDLPDVNFPNLCRRWWC